MRKAAIIGSWFVAFGIVAACASEKSNAPGVATEAGTTFDAAGCQGACCELPAPNTLCSLEAGTTCAYAVDCPDGLILSRSTLCTGGVWRAVNDCPATGGVDSRGCPAVQPTSGTACALDGGGGGPCGYTKRCGAPVCDGGTCVPVHASAQASCINGLWQTTPIGPC